MTDISIQSSTTVTLPPSSFTSADAGAILTQALAITDASGNKIFNLPSLVPGTFYLIVQINADQSTPPNLLSININGHQ